MSVLKSKRVTVLTLCLMTVAAVVSLRGLPMMAAEGMSMIFYILFATLVFLLPASLVSAELGSAFSNRQGGACTPGLRRRLGRVGVLQPFGCSGFKMLFGTPRFWAMPQLVWLIFLWTKPWPPAALIQA